MINKVYKVIVLVGVFLFSTAIAFAQVPCNSTDPDDIGYDPNGCPLDTWVVLLVGGALILTVIHLHRRQKAIIA